MDNNYIDILGYPGIFLLMLVESCGIPMPSEVIMPFSGFLVADGKMLFWWIVIAGTWFVWRHVKNSKRSA